MALEKTAGYRNGTDFAKEVIASLRGVGHSARKEIPLSFYLYVPNQKAARACEPILAKEGLEVEVDKSAADDGKWLCLCHRTMKPAQKELARIGETFLGLARAHGGQFDGWETNPYKMQGGIEDMLGELLKKLAAG
jgi:hypothetical protein